MALIAAGILTGAYMLFSATGYLGKASTALLFGLFGIAAYAMPVILIVTGALAIRGDSAATRSAPWMLTLGVLALLALLQVVENPAYADVSYMPYLADATAVGEAARHGGGLVGAILCYPALLLGGKILAYVLFIAIILISVISVTGLSVRDMSTKVGSTVQSAAESAVQTARDVQTRIEENQANRRMVTFNMSDPGDAVPRKKRAAQPQPVKPKKVSKRKKAEMLDQVDELVSVLPIQEALAGNTGRTRVKNAVVPVVPDIWDDLEPADDVPLIIKPAPKDAPPWEETPLPDTERLFGVQDRKKPASPMPATNPAVTKVRGGKKEAEPLPEITYTNAPAYEPPSFNLLNPAAAVYGTSSESPAVRGQLLLDALESFHVSAKITNISVGPVLTRFELLPAPGIRVSRITSLSNDIALALAAQRVRIEAPIPGKNAVGIEIPNKNTVTVVLRDIVESKEFQSAKSAVTMALGKDISGNIVVADLARMPHMLIAGATGSGKSVCINDIIISMVYKSSPAELKMVLIDPKMVELSVFGVLPHLLIPVVTEPKKAAGALRWAVNERTQRYKKFSEMGARDLVRYNELMTEPEKRLPKLVVIIDELADLMMVAPDEVEDSICRIAQLGRASGIHLIVATQRPSADIITGLIKANIPSRCAFAVSSGIDSRIILDATGAEKLLGRGDMLFHPNGAGKPSRLQCAFVSDEEVERIVDFFKKSAPEPTFDEDIVKNMASAAAGGATGGVFGEGKQEDELLGEAVRIVLESGQASISMIQRRLRVGYARAARLVDIMEQHGYVSGFEGSKPRRVLIKRTQYEEIFGDGTPLAEPPAPQNEQQNSGEDE